MQRAQIDRRLRAHTLGPMRGADALSGGGQRTRGLSRAVCYALLRSRSQLVTKTDPWLRRFNR